jgi:hypothetical protein
MLPHIIIAAGVMLENFPDVTPARRLHQFHQPTMPRLLRLNKTCLVGFIAFVILLAQRVVDPDYFWHLKTGEYIVTHAALPVGDIFSFTRAGQPWVLHEWLFEVLLYGISSAFGETGVAALRATLSVTALGLVFMAGRRIGASVVAVWIPMTLGVIAFSIGVAPRPQLLTYAFFALYLFVLLDFKYAASTRRLFFLPLVMVIWVNAHAAYAIGIAVLLLFAACEWLAWVTRPVRDPEQKRRLVRLTQAACLVVLASLLNPGLFERWLYPFQVLGMAANQFIDEWHSPDFHGIGGKAYLALVLLFLVAHTYATRKPDLTELVVPLFFAVQGCIAARHVPLAVLVLVPFTALALARGGLAALDAWVRNSKPARWYALRRSAGVELGKGEFVLNWFVACTVALCMPAYYQARPADYSPRGGVALPKGAADYVEAHGIGGNLFNEYADGGYLIYRLAPRFRVAVDGRADVYGDQFIEDYLHVYLGKADWQAKFERLGVDLAVLPLDAPIRQLLLASGRFREVYRDKDFSVLQRGASSASSS